MIYIIIIIIIIIILLLMMVVIRLSVIIIIVEMLSCKMLCAANFAHDICSILLLLVRSAPLPKIVFDLNVLFWTTTRWRRASLRYFVLQVLRSVSIGAKTAYGRFLSAHLNSFTLSSFNKTPLSQPNSRLHSFVHSCFSACKYFPVLRKLSIDKKNVHANFNYISIQPN